MFSTAKLVKVVSSLTIFTIFLSMTVLVSCLEDKDEDPGPGDDDDDDVVDVTPLTVLTFSPIDEQTDVSIFADVAIAFSEALNSSSLTSSNFQLVNENTTEAVEIEITMSGSIVTLEPLSDLDFDTRYTVTLSSSIESVSGETLGSTVTSNFNTEANPDTTPPTIEEYSPIGDMNIDDNLVVIFSEALDGSSVNTSTFVLTDESDNVISTSVSLNEYMVTVDPSDNLRGGFLDYTLSISTDVMDLAGNSLAAAEDLGFRTTNIPLTLTEMVGGSSDVEIGESLQFTFSADIDASTIDEDQIFIYQNSSYFYGSVSASGNTITFVPNNTISEFETTTYFYYGGLKDDDGNVMGSSQNYTTFTTVFLSENYWYFIYNKGVSGRVTGDVFSVPYELFYLTDGVTYCNNLWGFDDLGNDYFSIRHSNCAEGGDGRYLEGGGANGTAVMQDATNLPTGMQWRFASAGNGYYWMTNSHMDGAGNNYWFKGTELGLRSYSGTSDFQWYIERTSSTR